MENQVDWKMKYGNEGSETKQWQQGYSIPVEETRFKGMERTDCSPVDFRMGERVEGGVQQLVIILKILHKCVSPLSGSQIMFNDFLIMLKIFVSFCFVIKYLDIRN